MNTATLPPVTSRPKGKAPTIYEIKAAQPSDSHFFTRSSMRFFHQTLKCFSVSWSEEHGAWMTTAGMWDSSRKFRGTSVHLWEAGTFKHLGTPGTVQARKEIEAAERVNKK